MVVLGVFFTLWTLLLLGPAGDTAGVVTMRLEGAIRVTESYHLQIRAFDVKRSNVSDCGEACYADEKCMAASIGKFSDYAIKYECYLYELGYKVHDANGWNSYFKLIDGALPPSTPATVYREHYVVRQAGILRAYSPGEGVPESHAAAWAITGIVLTCVAFFAICCGVTRPRKNDITRMAPYGYDPQEVG